MIAASGPTMSQLWGQYASARPGMARPTAIQYEVAINHAKRVLRTDWPAEVAARLPELQRQLLMEGRSPATINKICRHLMALLRFAHRQKWLQELPEWQPLKQPKRLPVVWSANEIRRLWEAAKRATGKIGGVPANVVWPLVIGMIWDTGCRIGELLAARCSDVDLEQGMWYVPAENCKGRWRDRCYRLHPQTVALVKRSLKWPRERLVPLGRDRRRIYRCYKRLLSEAGLPADRRHMFHCLRRTVATLAAAARGISWAAEAIGHGRQVAIESYVHPIALAHAGSLCDVLPRPWKEKQLRLF